jgi:hypothetical protein
LICQPQSLGELFDSDLRTVWGDQSDLVGPYVAIYSQFCDACTSSYNYNEKAASGCLLLATPDDLAAARRILKRLSPLRSTPPVPAYPSAPLVVGWEAACFHFSADL